MPERISSPQAGLTIFAFFRVHEEVTFGTDVWKGRHMVNMVAWKCASVFTLATALALVQGPAAAAPTWLSCDTHFSDGSGGTDIYVFDAEENAFWQYNPSEQTVTGIRATISDYQIDWDGTHRIDRRNGQYMVAVSSLSWAILMAQQGATGGFSVNKCKQIPEQPLAQKAF
jgi:hypothetical protein